MTKNLVIVTACRDVEANEIKQNCAIAAMFGMGYSEVSLVGKPVTPEAFECKMKSDYVYLDAHANPDGFGERDGSGGTSWQELGLALCNAKCLNTPSVLLLAGCRAGLKAVAHKLFDNCPQIDYVCGPRWTIGSADIVTGFHVFIYNMLHRNEQPSCAVERASRATGYDFFCHDRVEVEADKSVLSYFIEQANQLVGNTPAAPEKTE